MVDGVFVIHGPSVAERPIVLDSPHSGFAFPADFGSILGEDDLRNGEDSFVDELYRPAAALGIPLLAALFPRTYLDVNRHAGDIDLELVEGGAWRDDYQPSGKAAIGKALVWRTLDDGRAIYDRRLGVEELRSRITRCHRPYHAALAALLDAAHARFGRVVHLNCHSMNAVSGVMGEGGAGRARADIVLGDRDGSTCSPALTDFVRRHLAAHGYDVRVNDPYKGVELVRAHSNPNAGRHSLQIEINKRLYMEEAPRRHGPGFGRMQGEVMGLLAALSTFEP